MNSVSELLSDSHNISFSSITDFLNVLYQTSAMHWGKFLGRGKAGVKTGKIFGWENSRK